MVTPTENAGFEDAITRAAREEEERSSTPCKNKGCEFWSEHLVDDIALGCGAECDGESIVAECKDYYPLKEHNNG